MLVVLHFVARAKEKKLRLPSKFVDASRVATFRSAGASWAKIAAELGVALRRSESVKNRDH